MLVKNGVPYDVAMSLDDDWVAAYTIAFGEIDGATFDFNSMSWLER